MSTCRTCRAPKMRGDACANADCPINTGQTTRLRSRSKPITAGVKHGFHAPNTSVMSLVSDYDLPIRARRWRSAS